MKVLIVDDDLSTRCILTEVLEIEDFDVLAAADAHSALGMARPDERIDAILMDYHMPGMDGVTCLQNIRKTGQFNHVRMYLMSAEWAAQKLADEIGVGFIRKPFEISDLLTRLRGPPPARLERMAI